MGGGQIKVYLIKDKSLQMRSNKLDLLVQLQRFFEVYLLTQAYQPLIYSMKDNNMNLDDSREKTFKLRNHSDVTRQTSLS